MLLALLSLFAGDPSKADIALVCVLFAALLFVTFVCLPVHESAHALAAYWLGDDTGKLKGRISLNPFAHLSPMGCLMMFTIGFGYARPVPVNINRFKNRKLGFALTSVAGPVSNLLMTVLFAFVAAIVYTKAGDMAFGSVGFILFAFFNYIATYNLVLALFNLMPIPPLDGSRLVTLILPDKYYYKLLQYERFFIYAIFALTFLLNRIPFIPSFSDIAYKAVSVLQVFFINLLS